MSEEFVSALVDTLNLTVVPDTKVVKEASNKLTNDFYGNPDSLPAMIQILTTHPESQLKQLSAVEAKKLVEKHWEVIDDSIKNAIRDSILKFTLEEQNSLVAHNAARVICSITEVEDLSENKWPDLINVLIANISSNENTKAKETSVYTLYSLLEGYNNSALLGHAGDFIGLLSRTLEDPENLQNRVYSFEALTSIASCFEDPEPELANQFKNLINPMIDVLKTTIEKDDSDNARTIFIGFNDFPYFDNKFVGDNLFVLINMFVEIAMNHQLDEDYRIMALQFLIRVIPMKKSRIISKNLGPDLTLAGLKIACDPIDDEEELDENSEENENEENTTSALGLRLLAELANELPPKQAITPIFNELGNLINDTQNVYRVRAGLSSVGVISAGAPDFISNHLSKLMPLLVQGLKNEHPIVKLAALKTFNELAGQLQNSLAGYHETLLPLLMEVIQSSSYQSIYKYATYALDGILEYMEQEAIVPYLEPLTNKLFEMLNQAHSSSLKTAIVSAIGSTAFAAGKAFIPFFDNSLKILEPLIKIPDSLEGLTTDDIELIASTFENISTVARAVGAQSFAKFAEPLIGSSYVCISSENPRLRESGFTFINNMAKVYGEDFSPFLPKLIPAIIKCLQQDELLFNTGDDEEEEIEDMEDIAKNLQISTGITMEKEIATIALGELASATKNHFGEYVEEVVNVLLEQTDSFTINSVCIGTLWTIVIALYENNVSLKKFPVGAVTENYVPDELLNIIKAVREKSIEILQEEYEITTIHSVLASLEGAFQKIGAIAIMDSGESGSLETLCIELMKLLKGEHASQGDEEDKEEVEGADESETELLIYDTCLDILVALSLTLGSAFNRIFASFKSVVYKNLTSASNQKRSVIVGALAEICVGLKGENEFANELLSDFVELMNKDSFLNVRGYAAFGIGVIIFYSAEDLSAAYPDILSSLSKLLTKADKEAKAEDDDETQDIIDRSYANACGCVARMALKNPNAVPLNQIVPVLLGHLPLVNGFEENTPIFNLLIQLYQSNAALITPYNAQVLEIFKQVFKKDEEREKLESESTLGREQNTESLKQFPADGLKEKVVELVKHIESK
ncbi:Kap123 protein [Saccharomycopsis crataegensis]|uniref:Kap123 protein n=1 Tax=Saccharomycopsis crataegensis TaxID=43959 RepID=A0AAV5QFI1_9ASCO|nr:Kap123 protein [Saccharomycopsis crataegensis]